MIGKTVGHYEITDKLGQGGMGEVYRAKDTVLGWQVAVKVLPDTFAGDPERLARLEREAKLLAPLNHPNIAAIHGLEEHGGKRFLVLELVEGQALAGLCFGRIRAEGSVGTTIPGARRQVAGVEWGRRPADLVKGWEATVLPADRSGMGCGRPY